MSNLYANHVRDENARSGVNLRSSAEPVQKMGAGRFVNC